MRSEEAKRKRILENAQRYFMTYGFSRVSMDEIAKSSGVGKGTVYQLFDSKHNLLLNTIDFFAGQIEETIAGIFSDSNTGHVEKLQLFLKFVSGRLSHLRTDVLRELEFNFPEAFIKIQQARHQIIFNNLTSLLRDGKQCGFYDSSMDERLVAHIVIGAADQIIQAEVLESFHCAPDQMFQSILSVILKGCLAEEYRNTLI